MDQSGGAAKLSSDSDVNAVEDRLSKLPDDVLVLILLLLHTDAAAAARTSVLSRRWRRVWALLPELCFPLDPEPHRIRAALEAHEAVLRLLLVATLGAAADSVAAWLPAAARRLSGRLIFSNLVRGRNAKDEVEEETAQRGAFELPCFENATNVSLDLGFLGLAAPPDGVFARLTELFLGRVRFHGPWQLGEAVSSPRCPCLQNLTVHNASGLDSLTIHSVSLLRVKLSDLPGLRQLTIVSPSLKELIVSYCFIHYQNQPVASISAPQLVLLDWSDPYDPSSVHLGKMEHLQWLGTLFFLVCGHNGRTHNRACLSLLRHFKVINGLILTLAYPQMMDINHYFMEDMTMLPDITFLHLIVLANGHAFGASSFHVLRMCTGLRRLVLKLSAPSDLEAPTACPPGCICDQPQNWKTEELLLNRLQEIEIQELRGSEHEVDFVKQLFSWATALKQMTVTFHRSIAESKAKELLQMFQSFSRPGICLKFYIYRNFSKVLYAPED